MSSDTPIADLGRVSPHTHRLDCNHASLILDHVNYAPSSDSSYDSVPNSGQVNASTLPNHPNDVHPGFSAATISAVLRLRLEGSSMLDSRDSRDSSDSLPFPGTVSHVITLFPNPPYAPPVDPGRATSPLGFEAAVDQDDIATEHILTGSPAVRQESPRSRFFPRPILIFDCNHHSPAPVPTNPGPSRRVFSIPIPTFDIPPTVALPPSPDNSRVHVTHLDQDLSEEIGGIPLGIGSWSPGPPSSLSGPGPNYSYSSEFDRVAIVSPLRAHHPRLIAWDTPGWAHTEVSVTASYNDSVFSGSGSLNFAGSTGSGLPNENVFPVTSTPAWARIGTPLSFSYDDSNVQDANDTSIELYPGSSTSHILQYPSEEPALVDTFSPATSQSQVEFSFTFNFARTGTLPPHPPGYLRSPGSSSWNHSLPAATLPFGNGPSHPHGTDFAPVEYSTTSYDTSSTFASTESSTNHDEIIGNRPEVSPFGSAIYPESYQSTFPTDDANGPARSVRVLPFVNAHSPLAARTSTVSPLPTEDDTWVDGSMPPTPSPPSRALRVPSHSVEDAYSYQSESSFSVAVTPENTLPPLGYPEDPNQVTLPSFAQVVEGLGQGGGLRGLTVSEGSGEVDENEVVQVPEVVLEYEAGGSEVGNDTQGSGGGHEGDDEDESGNEDEVEEDESLDLEYAQLAQPSGFQPYVLVYSGPGSSPSLLDYDSETEGSAHSDDGHVHYSTDSDVV